MASTRGLTEEFFVKCFISGLRDTIKNQVMKFQPPTLIQVVWFALLQENTMEAMIKETGYSFETTTNLMQRTQDLRGGTSGQIPPIRKISKAGMQERKDKKQNPKQNLK